MVATNEMISVAGKYALLYKRGVNTVVNHMQPQLIHEADERIIFLKVFLMAVQHLIVSFAVRIQQ